jgi:major membrane immunogen (membrane-anchored lipoprotein)
MNKLRSAFIAGIILLTSVAAENYKRDNIIVSLKNNQDTLLNYPDGKYSGQSRYTYTDEPYWGSVSFTLKKNMFTGIDFFIRDSALHESFDSLYEKHFKDNEMYIQQCRNDWKGVQSYPKKLMETQDIDKLDAITGATWSYNIFKASVKEAL